jgi:hypothetical protein
MTLRDTSDEALDVYFKRLKAMTPSERVRLAAALWEAGNSLQRAAIRYENPGMDEDEITFRVAARRFGLDLAQKAYRRT